MIESDITLIEIADLSIVHTILGGGQPILMLHGWGTNIELMLPLAKRLAPLGYKIHVLDLPGFGQSAPPPTSWSVPDYANFVIQYLNNQQLDKVHLIGHSFGGRIGLVLGADHPTRLDKMALIDSAGVRSQPSTASQLRLKTYRLALNMLHTIGLRQQADQMRAWYTGRYGSSDYKAATGVMRETFVKVVNEDLLPYAARVQLSTLLLWGDQDQDTPLWQGQLLEKTIPDAGLVVWEGAGHYSYLDRLPDTTRVIDHFFKQDT
jgi:pimeloyl-ACP methyl ester carboxylesterase